MRKEIKNLPGGEIQLTLELTPAEYQKFLPAAAQIIATQNTIPGFRPGCAPYDIIKQKFGEAAILEEALSAIVNHSFLAAISEEQLETIGGPEINVKKLAPGENLIYEAKVAILPAVTLPDLGTLSLQAPQVSIGEKDVEALLVNLAKSRAAEILENRPAGSTDLVKLDYQIALAGVPQENATQKDFAVFLGEHHMVPGFEEQLIGLSAQDTKKFNLTFPKDYFQKNFAGKDCEFTVTIKGVYRLEIPPLDDAFAQSLGQFADLAALKKQISENLRTEKETAANRQLENDLLKNIIDHSSFGEIPEKLIDNEIHLMIHELEDDLASRGLDFSTWLTNLNKTHDQLEKDLLPGATLRVKSILVIRAVAKQENIAVAKEELEEELQKITNLVQDNQANLEQIKSPAYRDYLFQSLTSQKVVTWLKEKIVK